MVLYGPPGSGKTTLARMVAEHSQAVFEELSAVQAGRAEVRAVIERAAHRRATSGGQAGGRTQTIFFLDEIHRFNKAQQDALLPAVEDGLVTLIGATTENPAFEVNGALLSRMRVYALRGAERRGGRRRCCGGRWRGTTGKSAAWSEEAIDFLAARSEGDARTALNALELALATAAELGEERVGIARVEDALQRRAVLYDKKGDRHYDYISAWIKATRGSDPDASLYYLAVMLEGGEDAAVHRAADGDPRLRGHRQRRPGGAGRRRRGGAGGRARRAARGALRARAGRDLPVAGAEVERRGARARRRPAPRARARRGLRAGVAALGAEAGTGQGAAYDYPHDHPGHVSPQELLPEGVVGARFYEPDEAEAELAQRLGADSRGAWAIIA